MRYHYEKPVVYGNTFGDIYTCDHPVYDRCTLFLEGKQGLAVIQQRIKGKSTYWSEIDGYLCNDIYTNPLFRSYFHERSGQCTDGLYPTVTVRQIMWALKMKPLKRERWETVFDRKDI